MKKHYENPIVEVLDLRVNVTIATLSGDELDNDIGAGSDDDI